METVTTTSAAPPAEPELHLWLEEDHTGDWRRWRQAAVWSAGFHVVFIALLLIIPDSPARPLAELPPIKQRVTPLYIPKELTQKAPNKGKIDKELSVEAILPRPLVKSPTPAPPPKPVPREAIPPPPQQVAEIKKPVFVEPPKIQNPDPAAQPTQIAKLIAPPPPPPPEQPKLALEQVGQAPPPSQGPKPGFIPIPNTSVESAIHNLARSGVSQGQSVGDNDDSAMGNGLNLPPSVGRPRSSLEMVSDAKGVDFRPYMIQVLAAVRRNWYAVYPEAARLGQRGQVRLEFAIAKDGKVVKVIVSTESGAKALDQSAIAAISASNPLPQLPPGFKGDRIVLAMSFLYNMPR